MSILGDTPNEWSNTTLLRRAGSETDRTEWLAWRRAGIGGSDIAAICGLSNFASPLSVWADKTGRVEPTDTTDRQRIGQVLEGALAQLFHERTGLHVIGEQTWCVSQHADWQRCTVDGFVTESAESSIDDVLGTVQFKTDGRFGWPEGVPASIRAQCVWEMGVTGLQHCWLAVMFAGFRFEVFELDMDADTTDDLAWMRAKAADFWTHVEADTAPAADDSDATTATIHHLWPSHREGIEVAIDDLAADLAERARLKADASTIDHRLKVIDNRLRFALADAEIGTVNGLPAITYRSSERAGYVVNPTTVRTLRAVTPKKKEKKSA